MSEGAADQLEFEVGLAIGTVAANSDLSPEECAEVLAGAAMTIRSGVYDGYFNHE